MEDTPSINEQPPVAKEYKAARRPRVSDKDLKPLENQMEGMQKEIKRMNFDKLSLAPRHEEESQTKLSQQEIKKNNRIYLRPHRTIGAKEAFNEHYRPAWEFDKQYVNFIAENREVQGDAIDIWTKPYAGVPAQWWKVPVNVPVWAPRYVAEQIKRKHYHRLEMREQEASNLVAADQYGTFTGRFVATKTINRLDAMPVSSSTSIFMGAS